jgi:hypothetical protein
MAPGGGISTDDLPFRPTRGRRAGGVDKPLK